MADIIADISRSGVRVRLRGGRYGYCGFGWARRPYLGILVSLRPHRDLERVNDEVGLLAVLRACEDWS